MNNIQQKESKIFMQVANRVPLTIVRGKGSYVWDENEKKYLDFICGIATNLLGHADAGLAKAINKQAKKLVHISNIFYSQPQIELGELLLKSSKLDRVWFCNSGAEANEAAIKLARKWGQINKKGAYEILVAKNGFHGRTIATISANDIKITKTHLSHYCPDLNLLTSMT